jgi:hypothetical protein
MIARRFLLQSRRVFNILQKPTRRNYSEGGQVHHHEEVKPPVRYNSPPSATSAWTTRLATLVGAVLLLGYIFTGNPKHETKQVKKSDASHDKHDKHEKHEKHDNHDAKHGKQQNH